MARFLAPRNGKVHVGHRIERFPTHVSIDCTGRAVQGCTPTEEPVNCAACLDRFAGQVELLGQPAPSGGPQC